MIDWDDTSTDEYVVSNEEAFAIWDPSDPTCLLKSPRRLCRSASSAYSNTAVDIPSAASDNVLAKTWFTSADTLSAPWSIISLGAMAFFFSFE